MTMHRRLRPCRLPLLLALLVVLASTTSIVSCASTASSAAPLKPPRGYANTTLLSAAFALGRIDLVDREPEIPDTVEAHLGLPYREVDGISLALDLYRPAAARSPAPAIVFIHGGSWSGGKRGDYLRYLVDFAEKGYVTVTVSYRLMQQAKFPAAVEDVLAALSWVGRHAAEYGIDPTRLALVGGSAGAHLALMAAYASGEEGFYDVGEEVSIRAVVDFYGPADLTTDFAKHHRTVEGFLGTTFDERPDLFERASPVSHVDPGDPPTLVFHGTIDDVVPVEQSDSLVALLEAAGVPVEYHRLRGWPHTMDAAEAVNRYAQYYMDRWFGRYLGPTQ